jgi:predicted nucleic acid-binding Zn ribbon protein
MERTALYGDNVSLKNAQKIGPVMDKILAGYGLLRTLGGWRIVNNWPEIVGDKIAEVSRAVRFSDDTLLVSVSDAGWRQQLSLDVDMILEKIQNRPGGKSVRKIRFIS